LLLAGPAVGTTWWQEVNGRPPWGCCRWVRWWPPLQFKMMMEHKMLPLKLAETSIAGPLGLLLVGPVVATTWPQGVNGEAPRGAVGGSGSSHH
jgi:hypothetical protein